MKIQSNREKGVKALRRAQEHLSHAGTKGPLAAKVANALEHCIEHGGDVYGPQLLASVEEFLAGHHESMHS